MRVIYETLGTHPPFPFFCKAPCRSRNRWRPPPHRSNPRRLAHHRQRREHSSERRNFDVQMDTPWKINIEPENDGLEDDFPFPVVYSQAPCLSSRV